MDVTGTGTDLGMPSIGPLQKLAPKPARYLLNWGRKYSLWVFNFGLACCAIEFIATSMARHDFIRSLYRTYQFIDGEDLKTLQSFVLYGDPWASLAARPTPLTMPKAALKLPVLTREQRTAEERVVPKDFMVAMRGLLARLLRRAGRGGDGRAGA